MEQLLFQPQNNHLNNQFKILVIERWKNYLINLEVKGDYTETIANNKNKSYMQEL